MSGALCWNSSQALGWLDAVAELVLAGHPDAVRWLPEVTDHVRSQV
jgi:hypothetical protein